MKRDEFKKRLGQLREVISRGLAYYAVWKGLRFRDEDKVRSSIEDQNKVLGRYRGFFTPVAFALLDMALMEFAKMFDTDAKTASLVNLLKAARWQPGLAPHASADELRKVSGEMKQSRTLVTTLKRKRDQQLAHVDASPAPLDPLLTRDFDKLAEWVQSAFNTLSEAHVSWEHSLKTSKQDTAVVLDVLLKEIARKEQEHEDEMVRIGLHEARRMETVMERRLGKDDMRWIEQSYGFTEEQMQRIEKAYSSDARGGV